MIKPCRNGHRSGASHGLAVRRTLRPATSNMQRAEDRDLCWLDGLREGSTHTRILQDFLKGALSFEILRYAQRFTAWTEPNLMTPMACIPMVPTAVRFKERAQLPVGQGGHSALLVDYGEFGARVK